MAIFEVHLRGKPLDEDVNISELVNATDGFTGADIAFCVNEAALLALKEAIHSMGEGEQPSSITPKLKISRRHLLEAIGKARVPSKEERVMHEQVMDRFSRSAKTEIGALQRLVT